MCIVVIFLGLVGMVLILLMVMLEGGFDNWVYVWLRSWVSVVFGIVWVLVVWMLLMILWLFDMMIMICFLGLVRTSCWMSLLVILFGLLKCICMLCVVGGCI